jgi:hypothetical protein
MLVQIWVGSVASFQFWKRNQKGNSMRELTLEEIEVVTGGMPIIIEV